MSITVANKNPNDLHTVAQIACKLFMQECQKAGVEIFITETYRSQARQNWLYEQGRTRKGNVVTWTKNSRHTARFAWDIAVLPPAVLYNLSVLNKAGAIARKLGITWGGDWKGSIDRPHFEVTTNWKMPAGYGAPTTRPTEGEGDKMAEKMWNPLSPAMQTETEQFIEDAINEGIIQKFHLKDLQEKTMTTDRLLGLYITIVQRRSKK